MKQEQLNRNIFNIDLLIPDDGKFKSMLLGEVESLAIFEPNSDVFNSKGLFSNQIFGQIGSDLRLERPGYVDTKLHFLHPLVYSTICNLGKKYEDIIEGNVRATFNKETNDFDIDPEGETGFSFFLKYLDKIEYVKNESERRSYKVSLVNKYGRSSGLFNQFLILPAGLRDYTVDEKGVPSEDEINKDYRVLIGLANRLKNVTITPDLEPLFDPVRLRIQKVVCKIYKYLQSIIDGKSKFIQSKWASRGIENATSNVITAVKVNIPKLNADNDKHPGFNSTIVGLYQYLKALGNITPHQLLINFISESMGESSTSVQLINPKTLQRELVEIKAKTRQDWTSIEGINNTVNKLAQDEIKNEFVKIDGYYLAFILEDEDKQTIDVLFDPIVELGERYNLDTKLGVDNVLKSIEDYNKYGGIRKPNLRPITYGELFFISVLECVPRFPGYVTRYPITGHGSIYPSWPYLKSTSVGLKRTINLKYKTLETLEYPSIGTDYNRSMSVHYSRLKALGGDHDGDVVSFILLYTDEAIKEVSDLMNSKEYYLSPIGDFYFTAGTDVIDIVMKTMTAD